MISSGSIVAPLDLPMRILICLLPKRREKTLEMVRPMLTKEEKRFCKAERPRHTQVQVSLKQRKNSRRAGGLRGQLEEGSHSRQEGKALNWPRFARGTNSDKGEKG